MTTDGDYEPGTITAEIARGEALETEGNEAVAIAHFEALTARFPDDARVTFAYAGALDFAGREHDAAAQYRQALDLGLPDELRSRMYVQFGSTLRNVGDVTGAVAVLEEGAAAIPDDLGIACFLALARFTADQPAAALGGLIDALLLADARGAGLFRRYQRSLGAYAAALRE